MKLLKKKYQGKKVFITGHTGFKGAWLLMMLKYLGAEVYGYALKEEEGGLYDLINGNELCTSIIADIRDRSTLESHLHQIRPDYIFHLAANAIVLEAYENPVETYATNVMGTVNLLDILRGLDSWKRLLIVTTDKVYRNHEQGRAFKEEDFLGGLDPYSSSKSCVELLTASFNASFFNQDENSFQRIFTARSGNVIGGGDNSSYRIMSDIIQGLKTNTPIVLRNPNAVRPWMHVFDTLSAYLLLAAKDLPEEDDQMQSFNFGPSKDEIFTVEELTKKLIDAWGSGSYSYQEQENLQKESGYLSLDSSKAFKILYWSPVLDTSEAVEVSVAWYKDTNTEKREVSMQQIEAFFKKAQQEGRYGN